MSHERWKSEPHASPSSRPRTGFRRAAIVGSAFVCLAALGVHSDAGFGAVGPRLTSAREAVSVMSDASYDVASLMVLGLSLIGGGRMIRRLRQRAAQEGKRADQGRPSRPPMAATQIASRRLAR